MIKRALIAGVLALGVVTASTAALAETPAAAAVAAGPVVKIHQGALQGSEQDGAATFLGVPYAAAPIENLRWRPPAAPPAWTGVRDATKPGASCEREEDCLFLNITKPAAAKPGAKLPVMVWIHGGGFVVGTSMAAFGAAHDGSEFAKQGVITVTLNYRLGRAGWFAHPALAKEGPTGNYGLMDQIAALKWVKANIGAFGGDPNNVTIFGESAGGISVLYLMLAPDARGLFKKAIAESSFPRHEPFSMAEALARGEKAAESAGVKGTDAAAAAALRKLPLSAMPYSEPFVNRAQPILDGKLIASGITQGFAAGRQAKVPLIIGGNSNEASLFRPQPAQLDAFPDAARVALTAAYDPSGAGDKVRVVNQLATDQYITEPDRNLARIEAKAGAPVWLYYFSYVPEAQRTTSLGAPHTAEIRYVFGGSRQKFAPDEVALSKAVNAYWAAFAKTGSPGAAGGPAWPRFDLAKETSLEFGLGGPQPREHQFKERLDFVEQTLVK